MLSGPSTSADYIVRGILIGGAFGAFGALFGFSDSLFRAVGVGMLGGFFAGLTIYKKRAGRKK